MGFTPYCAAMPTAGRGIAFELEAEGKLDAEFETVAGGCGSCGCTRND